MDTLSAIFDSCLFFVGFFFLRDALVAIGPCSGGGSGGKVQVVGGWVVTR